MEPRRAESFSDGVFAVAITVLVFNLLPVAKLGISFRDLAKAWPEYAGYVVSFLTIGIMWLNHHTLLAQVSQVDRRTLVLNLLLLMGVVAVPFTTALVADNLGPGSKPAGARVAAVTYGLVMIVNSVCFNGIWLRLKAQLPAPASSQSSRLATLRFSAGLAAYAAGTLIAAFVSPYPALAIYGLIAVYYLFEHLPEPASR